MRFMPGSGPASWPGSAPPSRNWGPLSGEIDPRRIQLWPDPKGFSSRAVRRALITEDPGLLAEGALDTHSAALVNLTALEDLLYEDLSPGTYGCDVATAIGRFHRDLSARVAAAWTPGSPFRADFDTAATGNARYGTVDVVDPQGDVRRRGLH